MKWYDMLWVGPRAARRKGKIISSVKQGKSVPEVWLITLAENPSEALDLVPSHMLAKPWYPSENLYILGIASGKQEAFELVEKMVDYIYRETGTLYIRDYFLQRFHS